MIDKYQHKNELNKSKSSGFLASKKRQLLKKEHLEAMLFKVRSQGYNPFSLRNISTI